MRLFNLACGIGGGIVELNDVLAGDFARIGDVYRDGNLFVLVRLAEFCAINECLPAYLPIDYVPLELGIRKTVSEGEHDIFVIPAIVAVCDILSITHRLVVAIADIYALFILDKVSVLSRAVERICIAVSKRGSVICGRICEVEAEVLPAGRFG